MTAAPEPEHPGRFSLRGRTLRQMTARGTIVNAVFLVGVNTLSVLRGLVVVAFLTPEDYGIFGVLVVSMSLVLWLKQMGVSDKYVQQDDDDQEVAFQQAFTLEVLATAIATALMALSVPLIVAVYDEPRLLAPGLVSLAVMPALALQAPLWIHYRRMQFARQRLLQSIDPIVSFAVAIALAAAGAGFWALLVGVIAGAWAAALVSVWSSPYKLAWNFDRRVARTYIRFSWPLVAGSGASMLVAIGTLSVGQATLGLAGAGAITFASSITQYVDRVDQIITQTMYPAICAVRDRTDALFEAFVKSNRLALMWGAPFGIGLALFAPDLVRFVIGERWELAIGLLQAFGAVAALNHVAFNWGAFYRALGNTRPALVMSAVVAVACVAVVLPALAIWGLPGLAAGMALLVLASMIVRLYYVHRLFPQFRFWPYAGRGLAPTLPPALAVLALRLVESGTRTGLTAAAELALFFAGCAALTLWFERALLREALSYLRPRGPVAAPGRS